MNFWPILEILKADTFRQGCSSHSTRRTSWQSSRPLPTSILLLATTQQTRNSSNQSPAVITLNMIQPEPPSSLHQRTSSSMLHCSSTTSPTNSRLRASTGQDRIYKLLQALPHPSPKSSSKKRSSNFLRTSFPTSFAISMPHRATPPMSSSHQTHYVHYSLTKTLLI